MDSTIDMNMKEKVIEVLKTIFDPEIPVNIYDLGLIYEIDVIEKNQVKVKMTLTSPTCPVAETLPQMVQDQLLKIDGIGAVSLELVWEPPWTKEVMSEEAKLTLNLF